VGIAVVGLGDHGLGKGDSSMGQLRIMSHLGDAKVTWDAKKAAEGDPEAIAAVREAERIFAEHRAQGSTAFAVAPGQAPKVIEQFDPQAEQIVVTPRIAGG
jgi:hypothetical protein